MKTYENSGLSHGFHTSSLAMPLHSWSQVTVTVVSLPCWLAFECKRLKILHLSFNNMIILNWIFHALWNIFYIHSLGRRKKLYDMALHTQLHCHILITIVQIWSTNTTCTASCQNKLHFAWECSHPSCWKHHRNRSPTRRKQWRRERRKLLGADGRTTALRLTRLTPWLTPWVSPNSASLVSPFLLPSLGEVP